MVRFHIWFLVFALTGGPLCAGYFLGFDALESEARKAAESAVREDSASGQAKLAKLAEDFIRETQQLSQRASLHDELLPIAAATGNPLLARDRIKATFDRLNPSADLVVVADTRGAILFRGKDAGDDFALPILADALRGLPAAQPISYKGHVYYAAVAPVLSGSHVVGAFGLGRRPTQDFVEKLAGNTGSGVALVFNGKIAASNIAPRERTELQKGVAQIQVGRTREVSLASGPFVAHMSQVAPAVRLVHLRSMAAAGGIDDARLLYLYVAGGIFVLALFWGFLAQRAASRMSVDLLARVQQAAASGGGEGTVRTEALSGPALQIAVAVNEALGKTRTWAQGMIAARAARSAPEIRLEGPIGGAAAVADEAALAETMVPGTPLAPESAPAAAVAIAAASSSSPSSPVIVASPLVSGSPGQTLHGIGGVDLAVLGAASVPADPLDSILPALHQAFLMARRECAESTDDVTLARFADKVRRVRTDLMAQHRCDDVDFEVYKRGGKAALRATPKRTAPAPSAAPTLH